MRPRQGRRRPASETAATGTTAAPPSTDAGGSAAAARRPQRQVPTRRVTTGDDPLGVDLLHGGEVIERSGEVEEGLGPAAPVAPRAAVLDVPHGDAATCEVERERRHQRPVPAAPPEPPVDQRHARPGAAVARRQVEVRDLERMLPVGDGPRGGRPCPGRARPTAHASRWGRAASAARRRSTSSSVL